MSQLLDLQIKANPPRTQQQACRLAVRQSIAAFGPQSDVRGISEQLAKGLFGEAFEVADASQRATWIDMMEREYRDAIAD